MGLGLCLFDGIGSKGTFVVGLAYVYNLSPIPNELKFGLVTNSTMGITNPLLFSPRNLFLTRYMHRNIQRTTTQ